MQAPTPPEAAPSTGVAVPPTRRRVRRGATGVAGAIKRVVVRAADMLPPPRGDALMGMARETYRFITGQGGKQAPRPVHNHEEPSSSALKDALAWRRARNAFDVADYDVALEAVEELLDRNPTSARALRFKRDVHVRRGDLTEGVRTLRRLRAADDDPAVDGQQRNLLGRLIETDPRWAPRIPGPPRPVVPRSDQTVMHLLKESLPYQQNGFTMRSRYNLLAQVQAGLDPFVVTSLGFPRKDGVVDAPSAETVDGILHHRLDLGPGYPTELPFDVQLTDYAWLAADIAVRARPAILHASSGFRGYETALVAEAVREHVRLPLVYEVRSFFETTWSGEGERAERGEHYQRRYDTENRQMRAADVVITIAEAMADDIEARGVPRERIQVIPNGVDPAAFEPMAPDPELSRRYRLNGGPVIGYVSNLDHPREGQDFLIEATARLAARGRDVTCLIVGDGRRREELEEIAHRSGARGRIVFTGRVPHDSVRAHYSLIDIFVVPRRNERAARFVTPLKPFEAMAMGKPLVVADLPALVEIAAPGERGLSFPAEDSDGLAGAVERLIADPVLARRLGDAGREWVVRERTWAANGARYRDIYEALLDRWRAGRVA
jgi:glycosyltransferase involved in cell wall biosynthesis